MSFGDAELPGKSSVFYSGPAAGSRSAVVTGNGDVFRFALGHSNGHDAHADDGSLTEMRTNGLADFRS